MESSSTELKGINLEKRQMGDRLRRAEDDAFRKNSEFEKLQALLEQKLKLIEPELIDVKKRLQTKETETKDLRNENRKILKET
jgi:uncharacterized tellurite resistance protein B-like protein